ncbi:TIGR02680 family protein [Cohnella silvisoli]|uniref:TIGR02680 family protein n=1 Tax=Cohnella silvisoli TaxID=2873699 RepID=A0ABV1KNP4_9BACL|nr:TIGR02680 family protein [Cohnella silvisoli]MCD9020214.1 TIGR02680 family protein [Cohnella silvisoli]
MVQESLVDKEATIEAVIDRWQMCRAGILNFWYFENDEFQLEEGRLILRGSNGSGKSVTMQSFLPLVLDGDKRAHRLDPFGSRDRKIEYYLLGEAEDGHLERTGYLWIEFVHPKKKLYKTIGIGLKARKGIVQVGFWGFILQDGRRINKDFWLYDRNVWLEQELRKPLSRKVLEEQIGAGGQVVQEQTAYRDMVNRELFGFHEQSSYQDLLQLLLQLRSPKLSKDFKPSAIYEILTQALPPLLEEELNPLSEVMEDMDQIADRLEELEQQRKDTEKIHTVYENYNRYLLLQHSEDVLGHFDKYNECTNQVHKEENTKEAVQNEYLVAENTLNEKSIRIRVIDTDLELLNRSDAIEKQKELELNEDQLSDVSKHMQNTVERISNHKKRADRLDEDLLSSTSKLNVLLQEQNQALEDLENIAREVEFREHDIYHRSWLKGAPEDDRWRDAWRRDLRKHKEALESAHAMSQAEREARQITHEVELQLGDIHKERNQVEKEYKEKDRDVELQRNKLRDSLVQWQQSLKYLPYDGENLRKSLQALSLIELQERNYNSVRQPVITVYEEKYQYYLQKKMELTQTKKTLNEEYEKLLREREEWLLSKEPEPSRSEERRKSRNLRGSGIGAPLYEVCEFHLGLAEEKRATLEETLDRSGLLDAWIFPGGRMSKVGQGEEEVWIEPNPQIHATTLAEVLVPLASHDCGLSAEDINAALRSFYWEEQEGVGYSGKEQSTPLLYADGAFKFGPVTGKTTSKLRAEFIGKETRRHTKELAIAQLEMNMDLYQEQINQIDVTLDTLNDEDTSLRQEFQLFPSDTNLQESLDQMAQTLYHLEAVMRQEEKLQELHKEKTAIWRTLQLKLTELTANWSLLKREKELTEAIGLCVEYDRGISELSSLWVRYSETDQLLSRMQAEWSDVSLLLDDDTTLLKELEEKHHKLKVQVERLTQMMHELGIEELYLQISQLKSEKESLNKDINGAQEAKEKAIARLSAANERLRLYQEQLHQQKIQLNTAFGNWQEEMNVGLVQEWKEAYLSNNDEAAIVQLCREITKEYKNQYGNQPKEVISNKLLEVFNAVRYSLSDFALENRPNEKSGRIVIISLRDQMNPQTPKMLLEELANLEEEQRRLLSQKDRDLYEEIILRSVGKAIRQRIHRANDWVKQMNHLMEQRNTSSGLRLSLDWIPKAKQNEQQLDTEKLVDLLLRDAHRMDDEEIEQVINHFRLGVAWAKQGAQEERESLRKHLYELLDYRSWFRFELSYRKGDQNGYRELTDSRFNVLSGGEKAMAMYIPLFAATYSRYSDARSDAPKIISLDEAFAGVDEENIRDLFHLLTDMKFDYMMTSQVLWGCYDTVPRLAIYELFRPKDVSFLTFLHYRWNGRRKELVDRQDN